MEQELTELQKRALEEVMAEASLADFYLSGGTALAAFFLHHRISDDLDFFSDAPVDTLSVTAFAERLKAKLSAQAVRYERLHDRHLYFFSTSLGELKMEFTYYPFPSLGDRAVMDGARVDDLEDLAANKLMALTDRFDPKDFVDLYFLLADRSLDKVRHDAIKKFGISLSPLFLGGELMKAKRIEALPRMLRPLTVSELQSFFFDLARSLKKEVFE